MIACCSKLERSNADFVAFVPIKTLWPSLCVAACAERISSLEAGRLTKGPLMYPRIVAIFVSSAFFFYGMRPTPRNACWADWRFAAFAKYNALADGAYVMVWERTK